MLDGQNGSASIRTFQTIDDSMAPRIAKGAAIKTKRARPKPGDWIVARVNGALLFREMRRMNGTTALSPINPAYSTLHFNQDEWKSVEILGVMAVFETPRKA